MTQRQNGPNITDPGGLGIPPSTIRRDPQAPRHMTANPKDVPFIDPKISDPAALAYAQGAELRRRRPTTAIPKYTEPVAYGPDVKVPHLLSDFAAGHTMAAHAELQRGTYRPPGQGPVPASFRDPEEAQLPNGIVEGTEHYGQPPASAAPPAARPMGPSTEGILNSDTLPPVAQQDPMFQQGAGSMLAVNQPNLARKYGVIRGGMHIPGQMLTDNRRQPAQGQRPPGRDGKQAALSDNTLAGLQALNDFTKQREQLEPDQSDQRVEREAAQGPAGAGSGTEKPLSEEEKRKLLEDMDPLDLSRVRNAMLKDILNNDEQRAIIERRINDMSLGDLVFNGFVVQKVPIVPGSLDVEFQSYSGEEDLELKRLLGEETSSNSVTERYAFDKYSLMGLTVSLHSINGTKLPDYRDNQGNFDPEAFWKKYKKVARLNVHVIGSLVANWFWFDVRVRKLCRAVDLGNG